MKIKHLLLGVAVVALMAACGGKTETPTETITEEVPVETVTETVAETVAQEVKEVKEEKKASTTTAKKAETTKKTPVYIPKANENRATDEKKVETNSTQTFKKKEGVTVVN
ncbi:MAG: hypothetical protein PHV83_03120 [Bacteroidales bacterium]|nr:hypothetical protein [Bacteroidales bacterium]